MLEKRYMIIEGIRLDGGTQMRAALDETVIAAYAEEMAAGDEFPAVTVYYDGEAHWLADGFHRLMARKAQGYTNIEAEIWEGSRREAVLYAISANNRHGLRRTNADKRKAVEEMLCDGEWKTWSDRAIARRCGVHHATVSRIREELTVEMRQSTGETTGEIPQSNAGTTVNGLQSPGADLRTGADGRVINVANIGKKPEPLYVPVWAIELMVRGWVEELEGEGEDGTAALAAVKGLPPTPVVKELLSLAAEKLAGPYRRTEMAQAINNLIEQRRQGEGVTQSRKGAKEEEEGDQRDSSSQTPRNDNDGVSYRELAAETPAVKAALPKLNATPKTWATGAVGLNRDWSAEELEEYAEANEVVGGDGEDEPADDEIGLLAAILLKLARNIAGGDEVAAIMLDDLAEQRIGWYDDLVHCYVAEDMDRGLLAQAAKRVRAHSDVQPQDKIPVPDIHAPRPGAGTDSLSHEPSAVDKIEELIDSDGVTPIEASPTPVSLDEMLLIGHALPSGIGRVVAPPSEREDRIRTYARLRTIYLDASAGLRMYEEMTGDFGSRLPMLRLLEPMIAALDRHLSILEHDAPSGLPQEETK